MTTAIELRLRNGCRCASIFAIELRLQNGLLRDAIFYFKDKEPGTLLHGAEPPWSSRAPSSTKNLFACNGC